jgi:hypothetical protein
MSVKKMIVSMVVRGIVERIKRRIAKRKIFDEVYAPGPSAG